MVVKPRVFRTFHALAAFVRSRTSAQWAVQVMHTARCEMPRQCTCDPWYQVEEATAEVIVRNSAEESAWLQSKAN